MPQLIEHIDAIARQKKRGVLYLEFHPGKKWDNEDQSWLEYDYSQDTRRAEVIKWFDEHGISWQICGHFANECIIECPYFGDIYINVPYDESDPQYQFVRDYIEYPDETLRDENVRWYYLPLEIAMKNAHHDEPGFWDKWADEL